jgi:hypothetical protein
MFVFYVVKTKEQARAMKAKKHIWKKHKDRTREGLQKKNVSMGSLRFLA